MEGIWKSLVDAHLELLNATGWGALLDVLNASWSEGGGGVLRLIYQPVSEFVAAVNWSEPFFAYLALFHLAVIVLVLMLTWRASAERIFVVDVLVLLLGWCSSHLNEFGRSHASEIFLEKGVNYFDREGLFISVVYWCPLFLLALLLQGRLLLQMLKLMIATKRKQLRKEMKEKAAAAARGGGATTPTAAAGRKSVKATKKN
ncbi:uncharacterized protein Tco025E_00189 [Trypanosoma conorhini]|uniref:Uncharacterized protein n=1 Tax=Trypanosoma conorhini TaxID=83891 RepID=A0A422QC75_9TRYP|nr:uncharacterized protein Tco025E_00189 [Trypanosoma conorhini]RNF27539.1 hypothetical protein Tco025E_00189 [Trypanosoma conorhini]